MEGQTTNDNVSQHSERHLNADGQRREGLSDHLESNSRSSRRSRKPSEKGAQYRLDILGGKFIQLQNKFNSYMVFVKEDEPDPAGMHDHWRILSNLHQQFMELHDKFNAEVPLEMISEEMFEKIRSLEANMLAAVNKYTAVIDKTKPLPELPPIVDPFKSNERSRLRSSVSASTKSRSTRRSKRSYLSEDIKKETARLAALKTEAKFAQEICQATEKLNQICLNEEMAISQAKLQIYQEYSSQDDLMSVNERLRKMELAANLEKNDIPPLNTEGKYKLEEEEKSKLHNEPLSPRNTPLLSGKLPLLSSNTRPGTPWPKRIATLQTKEEEEKSKLHNEPLSPRNTPLLSGKLPLLSSNTRPGTPWPKRIATLQTNKEKDHDVLKQLLRQSSAPNLEVDIFSGNPIEYHYFMASFSEVVENSIQDPRGRLLRLIKYTSGEAKELIKHCIHQPPELGYERAKKLLTRRYGDNHTILAAHRHDLQTWPSLRVGDSSSYQKFFTFLLTYQNVLKMPFATSDYSQQDTLKMMVSKLPANLQERWNRLAHQVRRKYPAGPTIDRFIEFMDEETTLVSDPFYSREAMKRVIPKEENKRQGIHTFTTTIKEVDVCLFCKEEHKLEHCSKIMELPVDDRGNFFMEQRLCFGCAAPINMKHTARNCQRRLQCKICTRMHPTLLHGRTIPERQTATTNAPPPITKPDANLSCSTTKVAAEVVNICIVKVIVRHPKTNREVLTYAMLDNCSQGTFIKESLAEQLGEQGSRTKVTVRTLVGETTEDSCVVQGYQVKAALACDDMGWVSLPSMYTRRSLPVDKEEIPSKEDFTRWEYLKHATKNLCLQDDLDVCLLIGANCPTALEPQMVIPSQTGGPYALKTSLGWCVVGSTISKSTIRRYSCNRIAVVEESAQEEVSKHHFAFTNAFMDKGPTEMIHQMYQLDFNEPQLMMMLPLQCLPDGTCYSEEDKRFYELMEKEAIFKDGSYILLLPFRDKTVILSNNKAQAWKCAEYLKKKFKRDDKFYKDYRTFMENLINKGYAEEQNHPSSNIPSWYLPHHGVYHPAKKDKIIVVFDCGAQCNGTTLNKMLLQGPDLTNSLVGVLMRFRQDHVAIMADIESMFYQVKVPTEQRHFLKFLWWKDGNYNGELKDYVMCVHVFGGTSSPSCSNYTLKMTANDNEKTFGQEAAKTLRRDFYVDDMLKSVSNSTAAIDLVHKVIDMCKAGRFRLTKFV